MDARCALRYRLIFGEQGLESIAVVRPVLPNGWIVVLDSEPLDGIIHEFFVDADNVLVNLKNAAKVVITEPIHEMAATPPPKGYYKRPFAAGRERKLLKAPEKEDSTENMEIHVIPNPENGRKVDLLQDNMFIKGQKLGPELVRILREQEAGEKFTGFGRSRMYSKVEPLTTIKQKWIKDVDIMAEEEEI